MAEKDNYIVNVQGSSATGASTAMGVDHPTVGSSSAASVGHTTAGTNEYTVDRTPPATDSGRLLAEMYDTKYKNEEVGTGRRGAD